MLDLDLSSGEDDDGDRLRIRAGSAIREMTAEVSPLDPQARAAAALRVALDTGRVGNLWFPTDATPPTLVIANSGPAVIDGALSFTVESFDGKRPARKLEVRLSGGAERRIPLPRPAKLGVDWLEIAFSTDGGEPLRVWEQSYAAIEPSGPTAGITSGDDFLLGLANGARVGNTDDETRAYLDLAGTLGAKFVRMTRHWPQIEPREGQFNWEKMDLIFDEATKRQIEVQTVIGTAPKWALRPHYERSNTPGRVEPFHRYVKTFAERYDGRIRLWEVFNEPDIGFYAGTLEEYVEILAAARDALKSVDPDMVVMTGGFTGFVHGGRKPGFQEAILRDHQDLFDIHTLHMHGVFDRFWGGLEQFVVPIREGYGVEEPLIFNETGMDGRHGMAYQAEMVPKKIAVARSIGAQGYAWYAIHDHPLAANDRAMMGRTYGLLTYQWQPKPALAAYNTVAEMIGRPSSEFVEQWELGDHRFAFVFRDEDGGYTTVLWTERGLTSEVLASIRVSSDASQVDHIDMFGNRRSIAVRAGQTLVPMAWRPSYLRTATRPTFEGIVLAPRVIEGWEPGSSASVAIDVATSDASMSWSLSPAGRDAAVKGRGPSSESIDVEIVSVSARFGDHLTPPQRGVVAYSLDDEMWSGELKVPVREAIVLSGAPAEGRRADFVFERRQQVYNRFEHDPNTIDLLWSGKADLSGRVWLTRHDEGLTITASVIDDLIQAPFSGLQAERGDGIEFHVGSAGDSAQPAFLVAVEPSGNPVVLARTEAGVWVEASDVVRCHVRDDAGVRHYVLELPWSALSEGGRVLDRVDFDARLNDLDDRTDRWESRLTLRKFDGDLPVGSNTQRVRFE